MKNTEARHELWDAEEDLPRRECDFYFYFYPLQKWSSIIKTNVHKAFKSLWNTEEQSIIAFCYFAGRPKACIWK